MSLHGLLTEIASLFYMEMIFVPHRKHTYVSARPVNRDNFTFLYGDDIRTSQETYLCVCTACCRDGFTFVYSDDVLTSQETHLCASTACYKDSFTFLYGDVHTSQESRLCFRGLLQ
jgi:hypothetical protein